MSRKLVTAALLAISAVAFSGSSARPEVPDALLGTWLALDGFAPAMKPEERPTCVGGDRADGTNVLGSSGEWAVRGGGTASRCLLHQFTQGKGDKRWTAVGVCGMSLTTKVAVDWMLSKGGSRLKTVGRYDHGDILVMHFRRCTLAEKIAGIGLPVGQYEPDDLDRRVFALSYARAASKLCPHYMFDDDRAAAVAKQAEGMAPHQIAIVRVGADKRPIPEIVREALQSPLTNGASFSPADDDAQIGNRALYCAELFKRFGKDGTLIPGLLREKSAPL